MNGDTGLDTLNRLAQNGLPGLLGIHLERALRGGVCARLEVAPEQVAPNGSVYGGALAMLADVACGSGCILGRGGNAAGFTTIEFKVNFIARARPGRISCEAQRTHSGRTTEVWDATIRDEAGAVVALFRCTQLILGSAEEA